MKLYGAYIRFPQNDGEILFRYSEMKVKKEYPEMIECEHSYFVSKCHSTRFFDNSMLNKEYQITDVLSAFYSEKEEKCIDWLERKRNELLQRYKSVFERLQKSEITDQPESE